MRVLNGHGLMLTIMKSKYEVLIISQLMIKEEKFSI